MNDDIKAIGNTYRWGPVEISRTIQPEASEEHTGNRDCRARRVVIEKVVTEREEGESERKSETENL